MSTTSHAAPPSVHGIVERNRSSRRGPSDRYRRERALAYSQVPPRDILRILIEHEWDAERNARTLDILFSRLDSETRRAAEAEKVAKQATQNLKQINDARIIAVQEATKAKEELRLYKFQYDFAQREIEKAEEVVKALEEQRDEAERHGAHSRSIARQLDRERKVVAAREEGRQVNSSVPSSPVDEINIYTNQSWDSRLASDVLRKSYS